MTGESLETNERFGIVVGLDGSDGSRSAMRWAATQTEQFGPIQPVVAWRYPWWLVPNPFPGAPAPPPNEQFQQRAEDRARKELTSLGIDHVGDPIVCQASAGPALVTLGAMANLVAVGTRGRDAVRGTLLGSAGMHLAIHSQVPVAIIPRDLAMTPRRGPVVVGVDGSPNANAALCWAMQHTPADTRLIAVSTYLEAVDVMLRPDLKPTSDSAQETERRLREAIADCTKAVGSSAHNVTARVLYGEPREVLDDLAADASLLVLGARGHRGVAHLLLGSVTDALVRNPIAPTIVVPLRT